MKHLALFIFCLCSIQYVYSIQCYVTDIPKSFQRINDADSNENHVDLPNDELQDCKDYLQNILDLQGMRARPDLLELFQFSCYTVNVRFSQGYGKYKIKGCIPVDKCEDLKNNVKQQFNGIRTLEDVSCTTCRKNKCNKS